jgi:hypothetical protein
MHRRSSLLIGGASNVLSPHVRYETHASLPSWQALVDPSDNVRHHFFLADVVEQVMVMALVEFERFVGGTGIVVDIWLPLTLVTLSAVPCRMKTGNLIDGNSRFSRSSARTKAATVADGWTSCAISGSSFFDFTTFGSREKSSL